MLRVKWRKFMGVTGALSVLALAACGQAVDPADNNPAGSEEVADGADASDAADDAADEVVDTGAAINVPVFNDGVFDVNSFQYVKTNVGEAIEGGTINFGINSPQPFTGIFNALFSTAATDSDIMQFFMESMYNVDENFIMDQNGVTTWTVSEDNKTFTFTINENAKWHDGTPLTARDWVFAHEVLASPDYDGVRFTGLMTTIVGIQDFRNGDADEIAGLRIIDDRTLEMEFEEAHPSTLTGGIWATALPYHLFGDVPVAEMRDHELVRENPIGFGPFKVETIVPGEQVTLVRFEDYWRGRPTLDGINVRVVAPDMIAAEFAAGNIDLVNGFPFDQAADNQHLTNVEWLGRAANSYRYIGFQLGTWDAEEMQIHTDPNDKMADERLRLAMWHALDTQTIGERLFNGLRWAAGSVITPRNQLFYANLDRPVFSPDVANELLDEAGFLDVDGDGVREDQNGEPLTINFFGATHDATRENMLAFMVQSWEAVGLDINLVLNDFNTHHDLIDADDPEIDVFYAGWSVGWDVNPAATYGPTSAFNLQRYTTPELEDILARGVAPEAFDLSVRQAVYTEFQEYIQQHVPVFPTLFSLDVLPVNNRVLNYGMGTGTGLWIYQWAVSSETAYQN